MAQWVVQEMQADMSSTPASGRSPGGRHSPLQYSCQENPVDRRAWWATVCGITESDMAEMTASRKHAWCLVVDKREKCKQTRPPCHFHCFYSCHLMSRSTWNVYFIVSNIYLCLHRYVDNAISCCCSCPEVFGFCLSRYPITASPSCLFFPRSFFSLFLSLSLFF